MKIPTPAKTELEMYESIKTGVHRQCKSSKLSDYHQWPFQEPKLEVPTIYKAYFLGLCKGISPQNMAKHMVLAYLHFRILEISHGGHGKVNL